MAFANDVSPFHVFDLAGNAWEWTSDWFDPRYYQQFRNSTAINPTGPDRRPRTQQLVVKGGSKLWVASWREGRKPETRLPYLGFRCVLPVEGAATTPAAPGGPRGRGPRSSGAGPVLISPGPLGDRSVLQRRVGNPPCPGENPGRAGERTPIGTRGIGQGSFRVEGRVQDLVDLVVTLLQVGAGRVVHLDVLPVQDLADPPVDLLEVEPGQASGIGRDGWRSRRRTCTRANRRTVRSVADDHRAEPPQVLALEVAADRREGDRGRLVLRVRRGLGQLRPDAVGQGPEDLGHPQRLARLVGLELLVLEPRQRVGGQALAEHDLLDREDALVDRVIDPAPEDSDRSPSDTSARRRACGAGRARTGTPCR